MKKTSKAIEIIKGILTSTQIGCTGSQTPNLPRMLPSPSTSILTTFKSIYPGFRVRPLLSGLWALEPWQNLEVRH